MVWTLYQISKGVMLSAASLGTEQQFCASASCPRAAAVALDVPALGWGACEVLHTRVISGDSSIEKELQEDLARN